MIQTVNISLYLLLILSGTSSLSQDDLSSEVQISRPFKKGWNLLSFPAPPESFDKDSFFEDLAIGELWTFNNRQFNKSDVIESGKAYWVYLKQNLNLIYPFNPNEIDTQREFNNGWNLFGVASATPIPIPTDAAGLIWYWNNGRFRTAKELLSPGMGYWIYSDGPFLDHVTSIQFGQTWDYGFPADSLALKMEIGITTDSTVVGIEADTPSQIQHQFIKDTVTDHQITWRLQGVFNNETEFIDQFGDGNYEFTFT